MRVFVTGSTGFIGTGVVKDLLAAGHSVLGLTRSDKGAQQLKDQGAEVLHGTLHDLETLKKGASQCDAVIHLAFIHDHDFVAACAVDKAAIQALGEALAASSDGGKEKALVISSGTMLLPHGRLVKEDDTADLSNPIAAARGGSEPLALGFSKSGVRASVVRLAPTVHGPGNCGFVGLLAKKAVETGVSAYVGDGQNRWPAGHRDDSATLYRLAAEKGASGSVFHAIAEEGVKLKDIATEIGKQLDIPVVSLTKEKAAEHFGWFEFAVSADNWASSEKTREILGWTPTGVSVLEDVPLAIKNAKRGAE
ncbi:putative oxidoreductase [Poronia punctata]|nr:putative oxidoreductase [Poronia punctata]